MNPYYFAFSHAVSPSGDLVATITFNAKDSDIDIVLLSTRDGKIVKNITQGFTSRYEYIRYEIDPSLGRSLAWSRDGDTLAFFARDGRRHSLILVDVVTGDVVKRLPLNLDQPVSPVRATAERSCSRPSSAGRGTSSRSTSGAARSPT
jgi:Tol biopolymer transport system component